MSCIHARLALMTSWLTLLTLGLAETPLSNGESVILDASTPLLEWTLTPNLAQFSTQSASTNFLVAADTSKVETEWNEFLFSPVGLVPPGKLIRLSMTANCDRGTKGYVLIRSKSNPQDRVAWLDLNEPGLKTYTRLGLSRTATDYGVIAGVLGKGRLRIDSIQLTSSPLEADLTTTQWPQLERTRHSPGGKSWFVDSRNGDDARSGESPTVAWKTLREVNRTIFGPGDTLSFARGGVWEGCLAPGGSGEPGRVFLIGAYGEGPNPLIKAQEKDRAALFLSNQRWLEVEKLELMNQGRSSGLQGSMRFGVFVLAQDVGALPHIHLRNLTVRDVNGSIVKNGGRRGAGIHAESRHGAQASWFDDLRIDSCVISRVDRNGITLGSAYYQPRKNFIPHSNVVICRNRLDDIGGDGIVPIGCQGARIESNVVSGCNARAGLIGEFSAGIWPWSCDDTLIQYNEVFQTRFTTDGQGFDCDYNCRNTVFQYNYSHDNEGGFMLLCNEGRPNENNLGNLRPVVRYNISQNDGARIFQLAGLCEGAQIYNNTIFIGRESLQYVVQIWENHGLLATNTFFYNNLFIHQNDAEYALGKAAAYTFFSNNVFSGKTAGLPNDPLALRRAPRLKAPGSGQQGLHTLTGYRLEKDSPLLKRGLPVPGGLLADFFGTPINTNQPSCGASEP